MNLYNFLHRGKGVNRMGRFVIPFYIGDYLRDTMSLNAQEHGVYLLLIFHYWVTGGLTADLDELMKVACLENGSRAVLEKILAVEERCDNDEEEKL